jgi:hypothetical protein
VWLVESLVSLSSSSFFSSSFDDTESEPRECQRFRRLKRERPLVLVSLPERLQLPER